MTDRLKGFTVVFEEDLCTNDAARIMDAVKQLRGVLSVEPVEALTQDYWARLRVKQAIQGRINDILEGAEKL
jgi:hypothetical protein